MLQQSDPRNKNLLIYVNGDIVPRKDAKISVFDSVVQGGDAVWEGLRLYDHGIIMLHRHLQRLQDSAKAMVFNETPKNQVITQALKDTLEANKMTTDVHIRLTLTRGEKITSGMDPRLNTYGCGLIIIPEWKPPVYDNKKGIEVITSTIRRNSPNHVDSKIHHNNLINNILAKIQANVAGVDAALMLDDYGFAAELNGTNFFVIKNDRIYTPHADACLPGITRGLVIEIANKLNLKIQEKNISLTEIYSADMAFCTGTMGELTPIIKVDGREIGKTTHRFFERVKSDFELNRASYCTRIF